MSQGGQNRALKGGLGLTGLHLPIHSGVERGYVPIEILDRCIREVTRPRSTSRNCWDDSLIRQSATAASFTGSVSPAISLLVKLVQSALQRRLMFDLGLCLMQPADRDRGRGRTAEPELLGSHSTEHWR